MYERTRNERTTQRTRDRNRQGARSVLWPGLFVALLASRAAVAEPPQVADAGELKPGIGELSTERPVLVEPPVPATRSTARAPDAPKAVPPVQPGQSARVVRPSLLAVRASETPRLDGALDDRAWQAAPATNTFTQKFPTDGAPPSERTDLRIIYDADALYVAFDCEQRTTPVIARLARRDRDVGADRVEIDISDGARTFAFWVNAAGVLGDGIRFNDTDYSADWDGVWDAQVRQRADGWSAEMRIPLSFFRVDAGAAQDWGLQARRYLPARRETDEWAYTPRTVAGEISHYGRLTGLAQLQPGNPIELRPFVVARASRGLGGERDYGATAGLDARWRITQNVALDATVNPDFAQVEIDGQVLNLTTFETFLPEKRPFFLDGMDTFQMPRMTYFPSDETLFYTRRIGAAPAAPAVRNELGEHVAATPVPATIYGAAKLRGTIGDSVTGSLLSAVTGPDDVRVERADGGRSDALAAPPSWFNVARVRSAVGERAQIGLLATATTRFEPTGDYPRLAMPSGASGMQLCPGGETVAAGLRCFHDSYVASTDGYWRSSSGDYVVSGQAMVSAIAGGPPRTLLDGTVIGSGDLGTGASLYAAKEGGNWLSSVEIEALGRQLDYNDLGYMMRQNHVRFLPTLEYRAIEPFGPVAEERTRISASLRNTVDGLPLWRGYYAFTEWRLKNSWLGNALLYYSGTRFDDREVGDGAAVERTPGIGLDVTISSDPGRRISASLTSENMFRHDGYETTSTAEVDVHVLPQLELQLLPQATFNRGEVRFVEAGDQPNDYLFGRLDVRSIGATVRANYTLTTHLTLQLYTQALLVAKHYYDFGAYLGSTSRPTIHISDLRPSAAPATNPDSQFGTLDVNAVLRWEFQPGSTMFLVYTRSQTPERALAMDERARLDLGTLRGGAAQDALLLKVSYWWN
jgi:hypothetical protein